MKPLSFGHIEVRHLPKREAEVLKHIALGSSAKEAAQQLVISERTVEWYINQTMQRLGARNRVHLITRAIAEGVLLIRDKAALVALCCSLAIGSASDMANADPNHFLRSRTSTSVRIVRIPNKHNSRKSLPEVTA